MTRSGELSTTLSFDSEYTLAFIHTSNIFVGDSKYHFPFSSLFAVRFVSPSNGGNVSSGLRILFYVRLRTVIDDNDCEGIYLALISTFFACS